MMIARSLRGLAIMILVVGVAVAVFLPDAYYGPCSVTTEFHCGYHPRTGLSLLIAAVSIVVAILLWVAAPRSRSN